MYDKIDVQKLSSDKLLNRHIHGQTSCQYNLIQQEAKQRAAESKTPQLIVLNERDRTMISQQSANDKAIRNHRISVTRAASKQGQRPNMMICSTKNDAVRHAKTSHVNTVSFSSQFNNNIDKKGEAKRARERNTLSNTVSHGSSASMNLYLSSKPTLSKN